MTSDERKAWEVIYNIYKEYSPALKQAAAMKDTNLACNLFNSAGEKLRNQYNKSCNDAHLILVAGYDILTAVYKAAKGS